ncbi:MAG: peptidoglycan-associated lipoprotein Pal [Vicinamibacteria bacterium]|nr:peptidoglycan-associated lipoprotein Pal [Vicinamibacteria bacterium]
MRRHGLTFHGSLVIAFFVLAACSTRRPPAILTAPTTSDTPPDATSKSDDASWNESGEGFLPIGDELTNTTDIEESWPESGPLADIHFDFDQYTLTDLSRAILEGHAGWIKAHPDTRIMIEGHCDERGTVEYNLALGDRRAGAVLDYLVRRGVEAGQLTKASYGKERPVDSEHNEEAWARNRRAHFAIRR